MSDTQPVSRLVSRVECSGGARLENQRFTAICDALGWNYEIKQADTEYDNCIAPRQDWKWAVTTCSYVLTAINAWSTDSSIKGPERHYWIRHNCYRLAAFRRNRCITKSDYDLAVSNMEKRLEELRAATGEEVKHNEIADLVKYTEEKTQYKTEEELQWDLGTKTNGAHACNNIKDPEEVAGVDSMVQNWVQKAKSNGNGNGNGHKKTRGQEDKKTRGLTLRPASSYRIKAVRWAWEGRIAEGTFSLLAGPEGIGKSTVAFWMAAEITKGTLPGKLQGKPKNVIIAAKEDSWAMTIVPRLKASGADLDRVFNITLEDDDNAFLSLPDDNAALAQAIIDNDVALVILDPLISQLDGKLDSHKDGEIRQGLEPLKAIAEETNCFMVGLIHFNKGQSRNMLDKIMGSKAFTAVARSVNIVLPDDQQPKGHGYVMTRKNNLGRSDLPLLQYHIESAQVEIEDRQDDDDEYTSVGIIVWDEESNESADEVYERLYNPKSAIAEALSGGGNKDERAEDLAQHIRKMVEDNGGEMEVDKIELSLIQDNLIEPNDAGRKRAARAKKKAGLASKKLHGERYTGWVWYINKLAESV